MKSEDALVQTALAARGETAQIDFKESFDPDSTEEWCEVVKDLVAMANTGGGIILFGVSDEGETADFDPSGVLAIDAATIVDKIHKYTGCQFEGVQLFEVMKDGERVAAMRLHGCNPPMVFIKPGGYCASNGKQKQAFQKGTVYFRHGAKSEPGTRDDLRACIERKVEELRDGWLENIRKVVEAPVGSQIVLMPPDQTNGTLTEMPIRVVEGDTGDVPAYHKVNPDVTHPYRQTELVDEINKRLPDDVEINRYDVQCINAVHDMKSNSTYCHEPRYGSTQYSEAFIDWVLDRYQTDEEFFDANRGKHYEKRHG